MQFPTICSALSFLSTYDNGVNGLAACDKISRVLTRQGLAQASRIESHIRFFNWHAVDDRTLKVRRVARLIERLYPSDRASAEQADSWDEGELLDYIRARGDRLLDQDFAGFYFKGSFWCFATKAEFDWAEKAWNEAGSVLDSGLQVALDSRLDSASANLLARWFGRERDTRETVVENLRRMLEARKDTQKRVELSYVGSNSSVNPAADGYEEPLANVAATTVSPNQAEHAWAYAPNHQIGLYEKFFTKTDVLISDLAELDSAKMVVSRGGAMLHEYAHVIIRANDEKIRVQDANLYADVTQKLLSKTERIRDDDRKAPLIRSDAEKMNIKLNEFVNDRREILAYASMVCNVLALSYSRGALTNADNYRLFCEDAYHHLARR